MSRLNFPALVAGALSFLIYLATLAPGLGFGDAGEFGAAGHVMGITHPPGNPLLVLLLRVVDLITGDISPIRVFNVFNAALAAVGVTFWSLVTARIASSIVSKRWQSQVAGAMTGLAIATSYSLWYQATAFERGFVAGGTAIAIIAWLVMCAVARHHSARQVKCWYLAFYVCGLAAGLHAATQLVLPSLAVLVLVFDRRGWTARMAVLSVALYVLGLSTFLTMPVRSFHGPAVDWGRIGECPDEQTSVSCLVSENTASNLFRHVRRDYYSDPDRTVRRAPWPLQVATWWRYYKNQWHATCRGRDANQRWWGIAFAILGLIGVAAHARSRQRASFAFLGLLFLMLSAFLVWFLDLRPVPSQAGVSTALTEARERDYFFMWGFTVWGCWAGLGALRVGKGIAATLTGVMRRSARLSTRRLLVRVIRLSVLVPLIVLLKPAFSNWPEVSRRSDHVPLAWAHDILRSVDRHAILVTSLDDDIIPIWYAQEVEGVRPDVVVIHIGLFGEPWFRQVIRSRGLEINEHAPDSLSSDLEDLRSIGRPMFFTLAMRDFANRLMPTHDIVVAGFAARLVDTGSGSGPTESYFGLGAVDTARHWDLWQDSEGKRAIMQRSSWCDIPTQRIATSYAALAAPIFQMSRRGDRVDQRREAREVARKVIRELRVNNGWLNVLWPDSEL